MGTVSKKGPSVGASLSVEDRKMSVLLIDPPNIRFTFDQTVELVGHGRFHWLLLIGTGIGCMAIMVEDNCMAFVLPTARCDLQLSPRQQGFIYVASTLGFVCSSHIWGFMADTWGRRKVIRTALLLCCITSAASSLSPNSWTLMVSRFVVGLCLSGIKGTSMSYLSEFHSPRMRPVHLSLLSSFIMSSAMLQPLMAMFILRKPELNAWLAVKTWRVFILAGSLVSGLGCLLMCWLPESPKFLLSMNKSSEALDILAKMFAINCKGSRESFPVKELAPLDESGTVISAISSFREGLSLIWTQTKPLLLPPNRAYFLLCCTCSAATFFTTHGLLLWFPQILTLYSQIETKEPITTCAVLETGYQRMVNSTTLVNNSTTTSDGGGSCTGTLNQTTLSVSLLLGSFIVILNTSVGLGMKRIGPKYLQTGWYLIACVATQALLWGNSFELNMVLMIAAISLAASIASMCGVFGDLFPTHLRSMAMNLIMMCGRLGGVVGSNFLAAMIFWHCSEMLSMFVAVLVVAAAIVWTVCTACERVRNI